VGAYGGKARFMDLVAPAGPVYQAGTLSGNPLAMAAGLKTLEVLRRPGIYERLDSLTSKLTNGLIAESARLGVALTVNRVGSMFTAFFTPDPVSDYASAKKADTARVTRKLTETSRSVAAVWSSPWSEVGRRMAVATRGSS